MSCLQEGLINASILTHLTGGIIFLSHVLYLVGRDVFKNHVTFLLTLSSLAALADFAIFYLIKFTLANINQSAWCPNIYFSLLLFAMPLGIWTNIRHALMRSLWYVLYKWDSTSSYLAATWTVFLDLYSWKRFAFLECHEGNSCFNIACSVSISQSCTSSFPSSLALWWPRIWSSSWSSRELY